jgi:hypothetical protein
MRDEFKEVISGWMLVNTYAAVTERIEEVAEWTKAHGPLWPDEEKTVQFMIEVQIALAEEEGFGIMQCPPT